MYVVKNVQEEHADQQVGAPDVDGTDEPAEIDLRHDRADALERLVGRRLVIERQQDSRGHLDAEQKQGHPAQKIEDRGAVDGDVLLGRQRLGVVEPQPLEEEGHARAAFGVSFCGGDRQAVRETMISSCPGFPRSVTLYILQGARRRARNVVPVQVVDAVVAVAEDVGLGLAKLDGAFQVGADGVEGPTSPSGVRMTRQGLPPKLNGGGQWPCASAFSSFTRYGATTSSAPELVAARGRTKRTTG